MIISTNFSITEQDLIREDLITASCIGMYKQVPCKLCGCLTFDGTYSSKTDVYVLKCRGCKSICIQSMVSTVSTEVVEC